MEGAEHEIVTLHLQGGGLEQFIKKLRPGDELTVETTSNSTWFRDRVIGHVARIAIIAPTHFEKLSLFLKQGDTARGPGEKQSSCVADEHHPHPRSHRETRRVAQNHVNGMCNGCGIKLKQKTLNNKSGFARVLNSCEWIGVERAEMKAIAANWR